MCVYIKTDHISITVKLALFISTNISIKRYNFDQRFLLYLSVSISLCCWFIDTELSIDFGEY